MSILEVRNLRKVYTTRFGGNKVEALSNVNFSVSQGEYVAIMGESGSGKTTLLNILAALDRPTSGEVVLDGKELSQLKDKELSGFRRDNLGFVFQDFNLLDTFTLEDNIYLPLVLSGMEYSEMNGRLKIWPPALVSPDFLKIPLRSLRRIKAAGRCGPALITQPKLILADEPTGALVPAPQMIFEPVPQHQSDRSDHCYGHPLRPGSQPCQPGAVYPGWAGIPPALSGRGEQRRLL